MAQSSGIRWEQSSATVKVGETVTVPVTYGEVPTWDVSRDLNNLATAVVNGQSVVFTGIKAGTVIIAKDNLHYLNDFTLTVEANNTQVVITEQSLQDIADVIREKLSVQTTYKPGQMASAISSIPTSTPPATETVSIRRTSTPAPTIQYLNNSFENVTLSVTSGTTTIYPVKNSMMYVNSNHSVSSYSGFTHVYGSSVFLCSSNSGSWFFEDECLLPDTEIILTGNSKKKIQDINKNDVVISYNSESNENDNCIVLKTFEHNFDGEIIELFDENNNKIISATQNHPIYANGKYITFNDVKVGDSLLTLELENIIVSSIKKKKYSGLVYNIDVDELDNYYAGDIPVLCHNKPA